MATAGAKNAHETKVSFLVHIKLKKQNLQKLVKFYKFIYGPKTPLPRAYFGIGGYFFKF